MADIIQGPRFRFYDRTTNANNDETVVFIDPFCLKHTYPKETVLNAKYYYKLVPNPTPEKRLRGKIDVKYDENRILFYPEPLKTRNGIVVSRTKFLCVSVCDSEENILFTKEIRIFGRTLAISTIRKMVNNGNEFDFHEFDINDDRHPAKINENTKVDNDQESEDDSDDESKSEDESDNEDETDESKSEDEPSESIDAHMSKKIEKLVDQQMLVVWLKMKQEKMKAKKHVMKIKARKHKLPRKPVDVTKKERIGKIVTEIGVLKRNGQLK